MNYYYIEIVNDECHSTFECDESQIIFDCLECGKTFCTETPEHENSKDGLCGYCSRLAEGE